MSVEGGVVSHVQVDIKRAPMSLLLLLLLPIVAMKMWITVSLQVLQQPWTGKDMY
jgi:hypothetical protein